MDRGTLFNEIMETFDLGTVLEKPVKVTGGLSHKMYKVVTNKRTYAVKELNSGVMKRDTAYENFLFSEKFTDLAKLNNIPADSK